MNASSSQALAIATLGDFSGAVLVIVTAVIAVGVGYLVYLFGWRKVKGSLR